MHKMLLYGVTSKAKRMRACQAESNTCADRAESQRSKYEEEKIERARKKREIRGRQKGDT